MDIQRTVDTLDVENRGTRQQVQRKIKDIYGGSSREGKVSRCEYEKDMNKIEAYNWL